MTESDPYAVLGVPRTATRVEIARAYRRLAKRHHPDAGSSEAAAMARINEAWHVLSDPARRARWDRQHTIVQPSHWAPAYAEPMPRRPRAPAAPASPMDSGRTALAIVVGAVLLLGVVMFLVYLLVRPADDRQRFVGEDLTFAYPPDWILAEGALEPDHRIVAHLATFPVDDSELCTSFATPCELTGGAIPTGEASILITAWDGGTPRVPEPVVRRPFGLDADAIVGGKPAAFELERVDAGTAVAWWQLSPPGFPGRWIEVRAEIRGGRLETEEMVASIQAVLDTVEFGG